MGSWGGSGAGLEKTLENKKMRLKKFNPVKRVHEWFVEAKLPPHN